MQHWRHPATDGAEFWISCKRPAFHSSFSCLQVIQNKRPWCWAVAYVTAGWAHAEFFPLSTESNKKKVSEWSQDCTDYKTSLDFFMTLLKWPKMDVKKCLRIRHHLRKLSVSTVRCWHVLMKKSRHFLSWHYSEKSLPNSFDMVKYLLWTKCFYFVLAW